MSETLNGSLEGFIKDNHEPYGIAPNSLKTAEALFNISRELIYAAGLKRERYRYPLYGETPFYQNDCSDVMTINRFTTGKIPIIPDAEAESKEPVCDNDTIKDGISAGGTSLELAVDKRITRNRNKLPIPIAFGRLALGLSKHKDMVLRVIRSDSTVGPVPVNIEDSLLVSHVDVYGVSPVCRSSELDILSVARGIEEVSRVTGTHDLLMDSIDRRQKQLQDNNSHI